MWKSSFLLQRLLMWPLELPDWSYLDPIPLSLSICHWILWKNKPISDSCAVASGSVEISDLFDKKRLSVTSEVLSRAEGFWFFLLWLCSRVCEGLWCQHAGNSVGILLWVTCDAPEHLHSQRVFSSSQSCWIIQPAFWFISSFSYPLTANTVLLLALDFMWAGQVAALCCSKGLQQVWPQEIPLSAFGETCSMAVCGI